MAQQETSAAQLASTAREDFVEPEMVRIPAGWFEMGCETGRDDEKPVHRVWVDAFELAAYQVTHAEDRKSTRLNSSHIQKSRMPSSA